MEEKELVIIGGGPAGYVAAIRAAQLGTKATLVEDKELGGICLNWGCVPTKFLLHTAEIYDSTKTAGLYGVNITDASLDLVEMQARKKKVIATHVSGVQGLLRMNKVEVIKGRARLTTSNQVEIDSGGEQKQSIKANKIIIATGSVPVKLPISGIDGPGVLEVDELLDLDHLPSSLLIIGGGVVGVEMASVWAKFGCKVTVVEMMPHCLPTQDSEIASILQDALSKDGVEIHCASTVTKVEGPAGAKRVTINCNGEESQVEAEVVAVVVGQRPNVKDLGLEECGIALERGAIKVDERLQTSVPGIYAAGDVIGGMMLAYVGMEEGKVATENALGRDTKINYQAVPVCIFTLPEVASVGMTEEEVVSQGKQVRIGRFPFLANAMATILGDRRGLVKIIADQKQGQLLGVHIIGPRATTLIPEVALAMKNGLSIKNILETMHAHPSLSEAIAEAALDVTGETIHARSRNKIQLD